MTLTVSHSLVQLFFMSLCIEQKILLEKYLSNIDTKQTAFPASHDKNAFKHINGNLPMSYPSSSNEKQLDQISMTENGGYNCPNPKLYDQYDNPIHNGPTPKYVTTIRPRTLTIKTDITPLAVERGAITTESMFDSEEYDTIPTTTNPGYNCPLDHSASAVTTTSGGPTPEHEKFVTIVPNLTRPSTLGSTKMDIKPLAGVVTSDQTEFKPRPSSAGSDYAIPMEMNLGYNCSLDHSASAITATSGGPTPEYEKFATTVPNLIQPTRCGETASYMEQEVQNPPDQRSQQRGSPFKETPL